MPLPGAVGRHAPAARRRPDRAASQRLGDDGGDARVRGLRHRGLAGLTITPVRWHSPALRSGERPGSSRRLISYFQTCSTPSQSERILRWRLRSDISDALPGLFRSADAGALPRDSELLPAEAVRPIRRNGFQVRTTARSRAMPRSSTRSISTSWRHHRRVRHGQPAGSCHEPHPRDGAVHRPRRLDEARGRSRRPVVGRHARPSLRRNPGGRRRAWRGDRQDHRRWNPRPVQRAAQAVRCAGGSSPTQTRSAFGFAAASTRGRSNAAATMSPDWPCIWPRASWATRPRARSSFPER